MQQQDPGPSLALQLLTLDRDADGSWIGRAVEGNHGRLFGGSTLAHALAAATRAAQTDRQPHSIHAYFVGAGRPGLPVRYRTETLKTGRSFDVVRLDASQDDRVILAAIASYHLPEPGPSIDGEMPAVALPDALATVAYLPAGTDRGVRAPFELRYADERYRPESGPAAARSDVWVRAATPLTGLDDAGHAALLLYAVDFLLAHVARFPFRPTEFAGASLDHAMWFHRPLRLDDWLLVSSTAVTAANGRALTTCRVFRTDGTLVASGSQEILMRFLDSDPTAAG